ncbi:hypothetical protein C8R44DRAFT_885468 [Mycena epipterygia]|nr:hypothetical protein C8R44DRAFT_885468 [Mycena epipterygia]
MDWQTAEGSHDHFRRLFGAIMLAQLTQYCPERPATMAWNEKFLELAFVNKFRLINYANVLEQMWQIIGGAFELKKIKVHTFQEFMPALERANTVMDEEHDDEGVMMIVPWSAHEIRQPLKEQYYLPLVKNVAGDCLRKVYQSEAFILAMAKEKNSNAKGKTHASSSPSPGRSYSCSRVLPPRNTRGLQRLLQRTNIHGSAVAVAVMRALSHGPLWLRHMPRTRPAGLREILRINSPHPPFLVLANLWLLLLFLLLALANPGLLRRVLRIDLRLLALALTTLRPMRVHRVDLSLLLLGLGLANLHP